MLSASGNVRSFSFKLLKHTKLTPLPVGRHFGKILPWFVVGALHRPDGLSLKTSSQVLISTVAIGEYPINSVASFIYYS